MESATHILGAFAARRLVGEHLFDRAVPSESISSASRATRASTRRWSCCARRTGRASRSRTCSWIPSSGRAT